MSITIVILMDMSKWITRPRARVKKSLDKQKRMEFSKVII